MLINTLSSNSSWADTHIMVASTLTGNKVLNERDEELGTIEEIMLDVAEGRVAYAVLAYGGVLGIGEKLFAIPWSVLKLDLENECFILKGVNTDLLERTPGFDREHWPSSADFSWSSRSHN